LTLGGQPVILIVEVREMAKRRMVSVKLPEETIAQLAWLGPYYGGNKTEAMVVAVAALYRAVQATASGNDAVEPVEAEGAK